MPDEFLESSSEGSEPTWTDQIFSRHDFFARWWPTTSTPSVTSSSKSRTAATPVVATGLAQSYISELLKTARREPLLRALEARILEMTAVAEETNDK